MNANAKQPTVLIILDGWGHREDSRDNAIVNGNTPVWDRLWAERPHTLISGSGLDVGLPAGQIGNSEVGAEALVTVDHDNGEQMIDYETGQPHTQHTTELEPLIYVGRRHIQLDPEGGILADIAPTLLGLRGLPQPAEMSGRNLASVA